MKKFIYLLIIVALITIDITFLIYIIGSLLIDKSELTRLNQQLLETAGYYKGAIISYGAFFMVLLMVQIVIIILLIKKIKEK
jgi:hypothetical protein